MLDKITTKTQSVSEETSLWSDRVSGRKVKLHVLPLLVNRMVDGHLDPASTGAALQGLEHRRHHYERTGVLWKLSGVASTRTAASEVAGQPHDRQDSVAESSAQVIGIQTQVEERAGALLVERSSSLDLQLLVFFTIVRAGFLEVVALQVLAPQLLKHSDLTDGMAASRDRSLALVHQHLHKVLTGVGFPPVQTKLDIGCEWCGHRRAEPARFDLVR